MPAYPQAWPLAARSSFCVCCALPSWVFSCARAACKLSSWKMVASSSNSTSASALRTSRPACTDPTASLTPHAWTAQEVGRIRSEKLLEVLWAQEDVIREGALHVLHKSRAIVVSAGLEDDLRELVPIPDATGVCLGFLAVILGLLPSPITFAAAFLALTFAAAPIAGLAPAALVGVGPGGVGHAAKRD